MNTDQSQFKYKSGVVLVVKDEVDDIGYWLSWYEHLGFEVCIVYDDGSEDGTLDVVRSYRGQFRLLDIRSTVGDLSEHYYQRQQKSYRHAIKIHKDEIKWLAFFDADEYLYLQYSNNIDDFLILFEHCDGIAINWCNYGSGGHVIKPHMHPVQAYTWHSSEQNPINRHVKSIVRPNRIGPRWQNVHCFDLDPKKYVLANGEMISWSKTLGIIDTTPDWKKAKLMHYQCRSMEHFVGRAKKRPELKATTGLWYSTDFRETQDLKPLLRLAEYEIADHEAATAIPQTIQTRQSSSMIFGVKDVKSSTEAVLSNSSHIREVSLSINNVRTDVINRLWRGKDPFVGFAENLYEKDLQGWGSEHPYLTQVIDERRPKIIIEVGVWKGGSTITMAKALQDRQLDGVVIAVDTWLGAWDHWLNDRWFEHLIFQNGRPEIMKKFMNNVIMMGVTDFVVPLPLDSLNAAQVCRHFGIMADVIHIDGAHDYDAVRNDLSVWWPILRSGGDLIGDDYYENTHWPDVKKAFDELAERENCIDFKFSHGKCWLNKK